MFDEIVAEKLMTKRGEVVDIGRFIVVRADSTQSDIPILSFISIVREGGCICSCISMQIDGHGNNYDEAKKDMFDNVLYYLKAVFEEYKENIWENLLSLFEMNEDTAVYWNAFFAMQLKLAEKGLASDPSVEIVHWNK